MNIGKETSLTHCPKIANLLLLDSKFHSVLDTILSCYFYIFFQISTKEAIWTSLAVLTLSILLCSPFIVTSELKIMFLKPGAYDHIAFCFEELSQWGQVYCFGDLNLHSNILGEILSFRS